jgi:hypothetical protein
MKIAFAAHAFTTGLIVLATFASVAWLRLYSQEQQTRSTGTQAGAQEPGRTGNATRVERPSKLDGTVDDPGWRSATPISNFLQREPFEGQTPT